MLAHQSLTVAERLQPFVRDDSLPILGQESLRSKRLWLVPVLRASMPKEENYITRSDVYFLGLSPYVPVHGVEIDLNLGSLADVVLPDRDVLLDQPRRGDGEDRAQPLGFQHHGLRERKTGTMFKTNRAIAWTGK